MGARAADRRRARRARGVFRPGRAGRLDLAARGAVRVGLREAQSDTAHDRYAVGLHHLAIRVGSREEVDERAEWLRARGAEIESGPREYDYVPGYYAVFFRDPSGIKLELVHKPV